MAFKDQNTTTNGTKDDIAKVGVGQGELYSPDYAIKIKVSDTTPKLKQEERKEKMVMIGVAADVRRNFGVIKERVLEKLAAAAVPADALENARHFLEGVVRDVTVAAQGLTKDALLRIKTHLVDLLPTLSPNITTKMVDDAEKEANGETQSGREMGNQQKQDGDHQPSSKALAEPLSRL